MGEELGATSAQMSSQSSMQIQELYESFNGFFNYNECRKAFSLNKEDI